MPGWIARPGAVALVGDVVGAELIAVRQQGCGAAKREPRLLAEEGRAGRAGESLAEEKIAVATRDVERDAMVGQRSQRFDYRAGERLTALVIADPGVEQVAENVDPVGVARRPSCEGVERRGNGRPPGREMQVGDEQRRVHRRRHETQIARTASSACRITTSSRGTSWWNPAVPVGRLAMRSTTLVPAATLPKTQ